ASRYSAGGLPRGEAPRALGSAGLRYGTRAPSTKSWIAPAASPAGSTLSLPSSVLISSRSVAGLRVEDPDGRREAFYLEPACVSADRDRVVPVGAVDDDAVALTVAGGRDAEID